MSDDVTNLAEVLAAHELQYGPKLGQFCACGSAGQPDPEAGQSWQEFHRTHLAQHIATLIAEARLIGAAMARTDAIAAHAELVERVEALIAPGMLPDGEELSEWVHVDDLRALIDPEATS